MSRFPLPLTLLILSLLPALIAFQSWERPAQPGTIGTLRLVECHPIDQSKPLVASLHHVFEQDQNGNWQSLWQTPSPNQKILALQSHAAFPGALFVLTTDGAFWGDLRNKIWKQIYQGNNPTDKSVLAFTLDPDHPEHWFLATTNGILESGNRGKTWFRFETFRPRSPVHALKFYFGRLFAVTGNTLYVSDDLFSLSPAFRAPSDVFEMPEGESDASAISAGLDLHDFILWKNSCLLLATQRGVLISRDQGKSWQPLPVTGLQQTRVSRLAQSPETEALFAATSAGIYRYRPEDKWWEALYPGLVRSRVLDLKVLTKPKRRLAVITEAGFFQYRLPPRALQTLPPPLYLPSPDRIELFQELLRLEPTPRTLHRWVIDDTHTPNSKTQRWHVESRLRALMPTLSFGHDVSRSNNVDLDRGSTATPDVYIFGPDDIDRGWDIDLRWDLGDLIFSSSQTSIDSRDKIMVALRHERLQEATRIYYERRRLQKDLVFSPARTPRAHFDQIMRIDELTALLDAMTGGRFSEALAHIYKQRPEIKGLWEYAGGLASWPTPS